MLKCVLLHFFVENFDTQVKTVMEWNVWKLKVSCVPLSRIQNIKGIKGLLLPVLNICKVNCMYHFA